MEYEGLDTVCSRGISAHMESEDILLVLVLITLVNGAKKKKKKEEKKGGEKKKKGLTDIGLPRQVGCTT